MAIEVAFSEDPEWMLTEAEAFLASDPVLHNLIRDGSIVSGSATS